MTEYKNKILEGPDVKINWKEEYFELNKETTRLIQENIELKDKIRDYEVKELRFETTLRNL